MLRLFTHLVTKARETAPPGLTFAGLETTHIYDISHSQTRGAIHQHPCYDTSIWKVARPRRDECVLIAFTIAIFKLFDEI